MPKQGDVALCSRECLGLITCERPAEVTYKDGTKGEAWTGIHLATKDGHRFGDPWCSREPRVLYHVADAMALYAIAEACADST